MKTIATFPGLAGFYVLTPEGQLGVCDQAQRFVVDAEMTQALSEYNVQYLEFFLSHPDRENFRLGVVYRTSERKPWGSETLWLEQSVVRRLYPLSGSPVNELTEFQKRNREKSIYRGLELLLDYKNDSVPDSPVYCPVLYDRGTTLDKYVSTVGRKETDNDKHAPVVEIVNLLAAIPEGRRYVEDIQQLKTKIYQSVVKKGMRKASGLSLMGDVGKNPGAEVTPGGVYADVDKRADRRVTLEMGKTAPVNTDPSPSIKKAGSLPERRPEPVDPMALRAFAKFRDLDHQKLSALALCCLVHHVSSGTQLIERGSHDAHSLYLLAGTVQLTAADGGLKSIEGGTDKASSPISHLKPRMYTVTALTPIAYLWIEDALVEQAIQGKPPAAAV